jgi:hypothetical protein
LTERGDECCESKDSWSNERMNAENPRILGQTRR